MIKVAVPSLPGLLNAAIMATLLMPTARAENALAAAMSPAPAASCIAKDQFIVVSRSGDAPGNDILARPTTSRSTGATCAFVETPETYRVARAGEAKYVLELKENILILDEGTGPSIRSLVIVDLAARRVVWRSQYIPDPAPRLSGDTLVFRKYLRIARKNDCQNVRRIVLQGLTPLYVVKGAFSLPARVFKATGHPHCIAGQ